MVTIMPVNLCLLPSGNGELITVAPVLFCNPW